jgi:hypothetical protein
MPFRLVDDARQPFSPLSSKISWNSASISLRWLSERYSHAPNTSVGCVSFIAEKSSSPNSPRAWK